MYLGLICMVVVALVGILLSPSTKRAQAASNAATALPYSAVAKGPYTVQGNKIIGSDGKQYIFHGIGRDGQEYNCSGQGPLDTQHLAYMGSGANTAGATYWGANTVRLPLSEGFWLNGAPGYPCTAAQYQATVKQTVDNLTSLNLNVILDLQWSDGGRQSLQGGGAWQMPDADSQTFWQQAGSIYKGYSNVLFQLFNEPHPASWSCWQSGCAISNDTTYSDDCKCNITASYQAVGMQTLVNTVRSTGATNLVLVGGMDWAYDLSQLSSYTITGDNVVYDTHPYPYYEKQASSWDAAFGNPSLTYPVISAESGEYDCGTSYMSQLLAYFDAHQIGWVAWAWTTLGDLCGYPLLVTDYQGTPSNAMGQYIYQHLQSYVPVNPPTTPTPPPGPVSKTWYFAEGRVGASYQEYLTLENPDATNDCNVTIQYLPETGSAVTRSVAVTHASRLTESVNSDLNIPSSGANGLSVSAIVSVNTTSSPNCSGLVAERPLYFTWHGVNSGSDVLGATHLGQSFYYGDVPTGSGYTSFITILNPPGNGVATVTAKYYAAGKQVGQTQTINVQSRQRGTIFPTGTGLPTHVAVVITATQPVVVERPVYFSSITAGNAGTVSGASTTVGAQSLGNDWLFAEGNTSAGYQENLVIANLDAANTMANVTITLMSSSGTKSVYTLPVGSLNQVVWNVNQRMSANGVAAEVSSSGAKIIVEREEYSHYSHTVYASNGFSVSTQGGTDVIGLQGPAGVSSYSFAEGYNNTGYNEWLALQNPTARSETISIQLVNGYGRSYTASNIVLRPYSYTRVDITAFVLQNLVQQGDDHRGYEVSMMVQSSGSAPFVAERTMYWNASGTQGSTSVMGYSGT